MARLWPFRALLLCLSSWHLRFGVVLSEVTAETNELISAINQNDECETAETCAVNALQVRGQRLSMETEVNTPKKKRKHKDLVKGISYAPVPCKDNCEIKMDDFLGEDAKPLWGRRYRSDLETMHSLGANYVRLYGNNPEFDHGSFLDEAMALNLSVVVGLSDYPYTQMQSNCMSTGYNCYEVVRAVYLMNLLKGFLTDNKQYHPALKHVIVINEPDLKLPGIGDPRKFAKGIISALDGMLDAEKEAGVRGSLVNLTATFSFGLCGACQSMTTDPGLGQMSELERALLDPVSYGYTPKNDLAAVYRSRWIHSFNTAAPASFVKTAFLDIYENYFTSTPVVIEEYHTPGFNTMQDLQDILSVAGNSSLLQGISFFEFQVRYDKGGSETEFGMFGLGDYDVATFDYFGGQFHSWCLTPVTKQFGRVPDLVADAYGGSRPDYASLCKPNPAKVTLTEDGYKLIASQGADSIAVFVSRLVEHLGGSVNQHDALFSVASQFVSSGGPSISAESYGRLLQQLRDRSAPWVSWDLNDRKCVADRLSDLAVVGTAVAYACSQLKTFDCSTSIPVQCNGSSWSAADIVFTTYFKEKGGSPLDNCYFDGAAFYAPASYTGRKCGQECCSYNGDNAPLPTPAPTLPPIFGTPRPSGAAPAPPPALVGNCSFEVQPSDSYFWDESCYPSGGVGCVADGKHKKCRFCGKEPFPECPTLDGSKLLPRSLSSSTTRNKHAGACFFANEPHDKYFWDPSCTLQGGLGCNADGLHMECRYCGTEGHPPCPDL